MSELRVTKEELLCRGKILNPNLNFDAWYSQWWKRLYVSKYYMHIHNIRQNNISNIDDQKYLKYVEQSVNISWTPRSANSSKLLALSSTSSKVILQSLRTNAVFLLFENYPSIAKIISFGEQYTCVVIYDKSLGRIHLKMNNNILNISNF